MGSIIRFLGRCGLIAPALLVLNESESLWPNIIGLAYIFSLILIFKLWKRQTPPGERKLVAEWSDTIDSLLLSCIQECGHWGWDKVDVGIERNFGSLRLEISGYAKVDYDYHEAEFKGNHDCPPDPDEYILNYIEFTGEILLWDESEEVKLISNNWNYYV